MNYNKTLGNDSRISCDHLQLSTAENNQLLRADENGNLMPVNFSSPYKTLTICNDVNDIKIERNTSGFYEWETGHTAPYFDSSTPGTFILNYGGSGCIKGKCIQFYSQTLTGITAGVSWYICIDEDGNLQNVDRNSYPCICRDYIILFQMLRDQSDNQFVIKSNHLLDINNNIHDWVNRCVGSIIENGGANIVLNGTQKIEISGTDYINVDTLRTEIPDSGGVGVTWNFMFLDASGKWDLYTNSDTFTGVYNNAGVVSPLSVSKYGIYTLYCGSNSLNSDTPFYVAVIDGQYSNETQVNDAISSGLNQQATNELQNMRLAQLGLVVYKESTNEISDVVIQKQQIGSVFASGSTNQASLISTNVTNFDKILSGSDTNVQTALETLDECLNNTQYMVMVGGGDGIIDQVMGTGLDNQILTAVNGNKPVWGFNTGNGTTLNTSNFNGLLSSADDTVQKAFDTLDDISLSGSASTTSVVTTSFNNVLRNTTSFDDVQECLNKLDQMGSSNSNAGDDSVAIGNSNTISAAGDYSFCAGQSNTVWGRYGIALGKTNAVYNDYSIAIGNHNTVNGQSSCCVGGQYNTNSGGYAITLGGVYNTNNAFYAFSSGRNLINNCYSCVMFGRFNTAPSVSAATWTDSHELFILGNGTDDSNRNNALTVYKNGNMTLDGALTADSLNLGNGVVLSSGYPCPGYNILKIVNTPANTYIGSTSTTWCEICSDSSRFYLNKKLYVDSGIFQAFSGSAYLQNSSGVGIEINSSGYLLQNTGVIKSNSVAGNMYLLNSSGAGLEVNTSGYMICGAGVFRSGGSNAYLQNSSSLGLTVDSSGNLNATASINVGNTNTVGTNTAVFGKNNTASGTYSLCSGHGCTASGNYAYAGGISATASGTVSLCFGNNSTASGDSSFIIGSRCTAPLDNLFVCGRYNSVTGTGSGWDPADSLFIVGNGGGPGSEKNALEILKNGDIYIDGDIIGDTEINGNTVITSGKLLQCSNFKCSSVADVEKIKGFTGALILTDEDEENTLEVASNQVFIGENATSGGGSYGVINRNATARLVFDNSYCTNGLTGSGAYTYPNKISFYNVNDNQQYGIGLGVAGDVDYHSIQHVFYTTGTISGVVDANGFRSPPWYNNTTATTVWLSCDSSGVLRRYTSSKRYKKRIKDLQCDYKNIIMKLRPVQYCQKKTFNYSDKSHKPGDYYHKRDEIDEYGMDGKIVKKKVIRGKPKQLREVNYGMIAEEVYKLDPNLVDYEDDDNQIPSSLGYLNMIPLMIKLQQEHENRINKVEIAGNGLRKMRKIKNIQALIDGSQRIYQENNELKEHVQTLESKIDQMTIEIESQKKDIKALIVKNRNPLKRMTELENENEVMKMNIETLMIRLESFESKLSTSIDLPGRMF